MYYAYFNVMEYTNNEQLNKIFSGYLIYTLTFFHSSMVLYFVYSYKVLVLLQESLKGSYSSGSSCCFPSSPTTTSSSIAYVEEQIMVNEKEKTHEKRCESVGGYVLSSRPGNVPNIRNNDL